MRVTIVGGGIVGTAHAYEAVRRGHQVIHIEREREARGATVRNFGLVWVSGRTELELDATLRSRELWERIGAEVPGVGFRPAGSLTLLRSGAEVAVAEEAVARPDAERRGFTLLEPDEARRVNPALQGKFVAALHCSTDAAVESRVALPAIRAHLAATGRYTFESGTEARSVEGTTVRDDRGGVHHGDLVLLCAGAAHGGWSARSPVSSQSAGCGCR